ncbi:glycosyl hydrolase [Demequina activiva]|uniref:glucan endo-1,3-beta-D-glucosidase n=1 Tax=Demequina activiva TaxID=1582364 RepID=A0A919Q5H1_9MICO|nr:glycosyl hydrolase [Demequina activiva]GIG54878.1 hypothetical protein Dac01nite_16300 [Demequina activiva]
MTARRASAALLAAGLAVAISGCDEGDAPAATPSASPDIAADAAADVALLPERSAAEEVVTRLADGVPPPTNRWYSSLAFGEEGLPVFPKPLAFSTVSGGFAVGVTSPEASAAAIIAPARADVSVMIDGESGAGVVSHAGPSDVAVSWDSAAVMLAQGWPVVGMTAATDLTATLSAPFDAVSETLATAEVDGRAYGMRLDGGTVDGALLTLDEGGSIQLFAVPEGGDATAFAAALSEPITSLGWAGASDGDTVSTTLDYGVQTVATMPMERAEGSGLDCSLGTYATIDGPFAVCATREVTWSVPAVEPSATLDLDGVTAEQEAEIRAQLLADAASIPPLPSDTYFGGKALARLANLVSLAQALGEDEAAQDVLAVLSPALREWGDPQRCASADARCFVYDTELEGVVGLTPSFGSEQFNDHHFHYGYFLYAAAVAVEAEPALADEIGPVFDLVAADIAGTGGPMPAMRVFDPVAGHSWASGFSPFADGNNQESSSEAVAAWNGLALWAAARGDEALEQRARWLLASEADAARRLWLAPDLEPFPAFEHQIIALEWGAKRDYATWFSPEPSAMLGIQVLPAQPAQLAVLGAVDGERIQAAVDEATAPSDELLFADYLLMYASLAGAQAKEDAWDAAIALPDDAIDDGNSRAYMLAWIATA